MRLKALEMIGFKSFAERTAVQFPAGITAVVGPNGCGKSNIVDALRWVMGEQSARHLRGHQMEDVIFNGSESLPATGMAEVTLTLDNEDGSGPPEYSGFSEIMISRRLFRSRESEYLINKVPCRLKDIIELFLGTGVGNKAYSIVEQGRVDGMVNAKPEDRRLFIEEAAGTSKYKSRKQAAERKLERTHQNLLRVNDIVREIERQIRSMELQAKKAERYRALREELKGKEVALAIYQRDAMTGEIGKLEADLRALEDGLAETLASLHSREAESEQGRLRLLEAEKEIASLQERFYQSKVELQGKEQSLGFYKKDLAEVQENEQRIRAALEESQGKIQSLFREIEKLRKDREEFVQLSLFEETSLKEREGILEAAKRRIEEMELELDGGKSRLVEIQAETARLRNEQAVRQRDRERIDAAQAKNEIEENEQNRLLESWTERREEKKVALDRASSRIGEIESRMREVAAALEQFNKEREKHQLRLDHVKERLQESRSRLASLSQLQKNYEGCQEGVRAIMRKRRQETEGNGIYGLVGEIIEAPAEVERALTAVLGDRLQYIIVQGHEVGMQAIDYLKRESSGRGSFIPRQLSRKERRPLPLSEPEVLGPLLDMVSIKEGCNDIGEYLLGDVVVVRDLPSALALWNRNGFVNTLVTLEGEVVDPMGVVTGGSIEGLEGNFLSQRREIRELEDRVAELEGELRAGVAEMADFKRRVEEAECQRASLAQDAHGLEVERVRLEHEARGAEQEVERIQETVRIMAQEREEMRTAVLTLQESIGAWAAELERRAKECREVEEGLRKTQESLLRLKAELSELESDVTTSRIRVASLGEKKHSADRNLEDRIKLQEELFAEARMREAEIGKLQQRRVSVSETIRATEKSLEEQGRELASLEVKLNGERERYRQSSHRLAELEESIREMRPTVEESQEEKNQRQIALSEKRLHLQHLVESMREKYGVDIREGAPAGVPPDSASGDLPTEIEELRGRLDRMGDVNLAAIGEFEELNSRYQFMARQKEDLEKSVEDLRQTIAKLNRICRVRFKESFEQINQRFQEIFPRLFRGGRAQLVLTDDNNYLDTGVEIVAQPPGKKLQSITLLSGGEKALTAVSLLFAIFLTKPGPFCFLDEVDAPLDDANLDRFNELVREMSDTSQFVLITHNKRTMQSAQVLYGITMSEPGVSKLVSVRME